jgi:2-polyprenyl-3-methyl-5-hydroxy-6-metoxy-1,4-benzoquinol methylase
MRPQMKNGTENCSSHAEACRRVATRFHPRPLRLYVAAKIQSDPAYPAIYQLLQNSHQPLLDLGCGVGLLAFYLRERGYTAPIIGLDCDARKIRKAQAIARAYPDLTFHLRDARHALPVVTGNIAMLDLLHYLSPGEQQELLSTVATEMDAETMLVLRDSPRERSLRFWLTFLAEKFAQGIFWNVGTPLYFASRAEIEGRFDVENFTQKIVPLWGRTPFNNHLFTFRRRVASAVPALE